MSYMLSCTSPFTAKGECSQLNLRLAIPAFKSLIESREASDWSADRLRSSNPVFSTDTNATEIFFTGEMVCSLHISAKTFHSHRAKTTDL